jgi:hypothetical protein
MTGVAGRNPREGFRGLVDAMAANYPGVSGTVPPALTPLGEERTQGATGLGRFVPFRYDVERSNETLDALRSAGVGIPQTPKAVSVGRGYGVELTETERDALQRARGAAITQAVANERAKPRMQALERDLRQARPGSDQYQQALARYNGALQATVSGAAQTANNAFVRQLGREGVAARMKVTKEIEPTFLGTPPEPEVVNGG